MKERAGKRSKGREGKKREGKRRGKLGEEVRKMKAYSEGKTVFEILDLNPNSAA